MIGIGKRFAANISQNPCFIGPRCRMLPQISARIRYAMRADCGANCGAGMRDKLSAKGVKAAGAGPMQDGAGLILIRSEAGGKWIFRYTFAGKRRDMGLGAMPDVGLADARKARDKWQAVIQGGQDPITERARQIAAERANIEAHSPTLAEVSQTVFDARKGKLRGDGARGRWFTPLKVYVLPKIGNRPIADLHQRDIHAILSPIWKTMHPTAEKAIQRLGIVFTQARLMGIDCDPFIIAAARAMLGEYHHAVQHITATRWQDMPALWLQLDKGLESHRCLRLMILTCVRSDAARGARYSEFDGDVWTVPADRVKGSHTGAKAFRVPMTAAAMAVVEQHREYHEDDRVFPSIGAGSISARAIEKAMDVIGEAGRPHGFRTSFRTWVQDTSACGYDVAETVLGHVVGGKTERTYARSDMLDQRRAVLVAWADYVMGKDE